MSKFVTMGIANKLDHEDFEALKGTEFFTRMMRNRLVLNYDVSIPNVTVNAIEDFIEKNTRGIWYSRVSRGAVIFYFEQDAERAYVASMVIRMINQ